MTFNGDRPIGSTLPDDAADGRGVLSHLAGVEHGSHGELVDGQIDLTDQDRARLNAGGPLVLRLGVPDDAPHAGGLASSGRRPASCRWIRPWKSIPATHCPPTWVSTLMPP